MILISGKVVREIEFSVKESNGELLQLMILLIADDLKSGIIGVVSHHLISHMLQDLILASESVDLPLLLTEKQI